MKRRFERNRDLHLTCRAALLILLVSATAWAIMPAHRIQDSFDPAGVITRQADRQTRGNQPTPSVNVSMFDVDLWYIPPVAVERQPVVPAPAPVQVRYTLVAITRMGGSTEPPRWHAVIYDPDEDQLHQVVQGDRLGSMTVIDIEESKVILEHGQQRTTLRREDPEVGP